MVLDEVKSAAGIHNHDCVTGCPRSVGGGAGGADDSWSNKLLRRGWNLTRKAAIAAAAATAAPPLIVLSAAGVALSVPFAAYLASLAATDHLMGALLRSCQLPSHPYSREEYDDLEQEFLDAPEGYGRDAPASGHFDGETEQGIVEEENVRDISLPLSRDPGVSEATAPWFADDDVQGEFSAQEPGRDSYTSNSGNALLPVSRDPVVSEAPSPSFADDQVEEEEEVEGEISAQESGQDSYTSNRSDETVGHTPMRLSVAALAKPLFAEEDNVVQKEGGGFSVLNSDQQSLQSNYWIENEDGLYSKNNEEDGKSMEENKSANEMMQQGFYFPESRVPATGDDDNVVQEKGEDEFSVQNSGQQQSFQIQSKNFGEKEEEDGKTMEENKPTTVSQETPAFAYFDTEKEQAIIKEEEESDSSLLLSQDPGVSEASAPAFPVDEVEEPQGEFSAQTSRHDSYTSNRGGNTDEYTPMEGSGSTQKETLPGGFDVSGSAKPLFPEEHNVAQEKGNGEEAVEVSGQQSFQSNIWNEKEDDVYPQKEEGDGKSVEDNKSMEETVSQGFCFPRPRVPPSGEADDNVVQEKEEGEFSAGILGQQSLQTKNSSDEKEEEDEKTMEENKSTEETLLQGFYESSVPASDDEDDVIQEKREGDFSVQNSDQLPLQSRIWNGKEEDGKTIEENKFTEVTNSQGSYFPKSSMPASGDEDNVLHEKEKGEFSVQDLGQCSLFSDIGNKKEHDITMEEKKSTEDLAPRDVVGSGSPAPVLHGEDNAVQSEEGFEVAAQEVLKEANSNTDVVMAEVVDAQVEIIATAAPESEVLSPSSDLDMAGAVDAQVEIIATAAPESEVLPASTDLGMAEVVDMQVEIIATAAPDTEALSPSDLVARELHPDLVTAEDNDVYVAIVAAAEPESEVLHESNLLVCASTVDLGTGVAKPMEENKPTMVSQEAPAYFDTETEHSIIKEEKESDTSLLLSQDPGVSEASTPAFAVDEVEEEVQGEFSDQISDQNSYTPMQGRGSTQKERLPGGFGVSASAKPPFAEEHDVAQEKGNGEEAVQVSGQQSFQSNIWNEKVDDVYPKKGGDGKSVEENKSMEETVSQGFCFSRWRVPPLGEANDNVVQEKEEGEFSAGILGQQSFQTKNGSDEKEEEDGKTTEENKSAKETVPHDFYFPESLVPASGDDDNVVHEKGEDEFSVQNSSQQQSFQFQSKNFGEKEEAGGKTMEESKHTMVSQEAPAFTYFDSETEQAIIKEEEKSDTSLLLSLDPGVSEASAPAFAIDEVEEEVQGEFSAQTSGQDSYTSNRGDDAEEYTPMEGRGSTQKETLKGGFDVSGSAKPLFAEEHNVAQEKGNGEEAVQVSGQILFQLNIYNEKEDDVYPKKESDGKYVEENKSMEETVSQGLPPSGKANDNVVQEKEDGEFSAGILGQQSFQTKNGSDEKEEDEKTMEENKSAKETVPQGFYESYVPASDDEDNVVQEKREGEYSVQKNSDQLPLHSKSWNDKEEEGKTIGGNKSNEPTHSQGSYFPKSSVPASGDEDNVVNEKVKGEFYVHNLGQYSLLSDIGDKQEHDITMEEKKSTKELAPQDLIGSGSPAPVLHGEDNAVQRKEGFEVAAQGIPEEANSNTDLVMAELVDVQVETIATVAPQSEVLPRTTDLVMAEVDPQVEIIATAAPESEVLPPSTDLVIAEVVDVQVEIIPTAAPDSEALSLSNLVARELHLDLVTGEINDLYVASVASAEPEDNLLHESNLAVCASSGEISDVQVNVAASAKPEDEALQLSNLASCESQAVVETAHVGDIIGIAAMEDIVRNVSDVNKEDMECCLVPAASMHDTEDVISSGSTPYFSTMGDEIIDLPDQSSDVGYTVMNEAIGGRVVAHGEAHYTEEQLREQLDMIKTITGYDAAPSSTLEAELAGLYIFVGVEPPVGSSDSSDRLMEFSAKLRFLKSIIGVD